MKRRFFFRLGIVFAAFLLSLLLLEAFVGDVYHVDTRSMEPTILGSRVGGEYVFVRFDDSPPERYELVVIHRKNGGAPIVKRVIGLPSETLQIQRGHVLVDGRILAPAEPRPAMIPIFDDRLHPVEDAFHMGADWVRTGDAWQVDARGVGANEQAGLMFLHKGIHDGWLDPEGAMVLGDVELYDAALEFDFRFDDPGGRVRADLAEMGDTFKLVVEPHPHNGGGEATLRLSRRTRSDAEEVLGEVTVALEIGAWYHLRFQNRDNQLTVSFADQGTVLASAYEKNTFHPSDELKRGTSPTARAAFGAEETRASFRAIRVYRDLDHLPRGKFGVDSAVRLGPDEIFVLGDNSDESLDSRDYGPVHLDEVVGRPLWVVWPPAAWRALR